MAVRLGAARAAGLPQFQSLSGKGGRNRIDERQGLGALTSEPVSPIHALIGIGGLESGQLGGLVPGGGAVKRHGAEPIGIETDTQQLGVNVGAFEFGSDGAQVAGGAADAVAQGGGAA